MSSAAEADDPSAVVAASGGESTWSPGGLFSLSVQSHPRPHLGAVHPKPGWFRPSVSMGAGDSLLQFSPALMLPLSCA